MDMEGIQFIILFNQDPMRVELFFDQATNEYKFKVIVEVRVRVKRCDIEF
jgi:hypothetical protein